MPPGLILLAVWAAGWLIGLIRLPVLDQCQLACRVTRSGVLTAPPSIGNADCLPVGHLMAPRCTAMQPGVGLRSIRLGGQLPGGLGCPGPFTGPGHPGWDDRPWHGRMTGTA